MFSHIQKDVLTEILNIQLGRAADKLSDMVNQKIILSVPELEMQSGTDLDFSSLKHKELLSINDSIITKVKFNGKFSGSSAIVFPLDKAHNLVNACLDKDITQENVQYLSNEDADVIKEICNIILNSILGEFGNILEVKLEYSSLETVYSLDNMDNKNIFPAGSKVLVLYTSFFLTKSRVRGIILIALSPESYELLTNKIDSILRGLDV